MKTTVLLLILTLSLSSCLLENKHQAVAKSISINSSDINAEDHFVSALRNSQANRSSANIVVANNLNSSKEKYRGDVYIMWGNLDEEMGQTEWSEFFLVVRYLTKKNYKVIVNSYARVSDVKFAFKDQEMVSFIWSGHGDGGVLKDKNYEELPKNIFSKPPKSLKEIIISACDGELLKTNYQFSPKVKLTTWVGATDSTEFIQYFNSDEWIEFMK